MNQKVLHTLEYYKITEMLEKEASTPLGRKYCKKLHPADSLPRIQKLQTETSDALSRVLAKGHLSFRGVSDIRPSIKRLEVGGILTSKELLDISRMLSTALTVKNYDAQENIEDSLTESFVSLEPLSPLNKAITAAIIDEEEYSDDASPELLRIRRSVKNTNNKIHDTLNKLINQSSTQTMLQENIITMRDGRYCIPVKSEYKNQMKGMVHDQSSTGSTFFIEPMAVVDLNNELKELALKEAEEIQRILASLSAEAALFTDALSNDFKTLCALDFIFARAYLSRQMKGSEPVFNNRGYINIKKGRHPFIDPHKIVPIDIHIGEDFHMLIITGPNTGGKTVSLKTVGLFTLMGQSGLHIPAFDKSELSVFHQVYADIGDEQSIEQSLSTFSGHMTNTVSILDKADNRSLVLFDELGAGTDPTEGAALAISILNNLHQRGATTIATTHYSELKVFALTEPDVENACCEFDVASLQPTYRLLIGVPGKSNAFAISKKLGLSEDIISDARQRISTSDQSLEDVISDLEGSRISLEKEQAEIARYKAEIAELRARLQQKNDKIDHAKERILRNANEEARDIIQKAKDLADESIRKYNKWSKNADYAKEMEQQRLALRNSLNETQDKLSLKTKAKKGKKINPKTLRLGDSVFVHSLNLKGTVSSLPDNKGELFVQMGILRSKVALSDIELAEEENTTGASLKPQNKNTGAGKIKMSKSATIRPEVNLIGMTVDEALPVMEKYLDDAYLSGLPQVTVIHGRGTGALKNAVHGQLKRISYVKSYRLGGFGEGDMGVTIVEFK
ncbi:MAG: endonuclease MutS2 [Lachnospiraceae bacterium]|nr:endonuclease MutS2 [Lachnospiraceae bacterium]